MAKFEGVGPPDAVAKLEALMRLGISRDVATQILVMLGVIDPPDIGVHTPHCMSAGYTHERVAMSPRFHDLVNQYIRAGFDPRTAKRAAEIATGEKVPVQPVTFSAGAPASPKLTAGCREVLKHLAVTNPRVTKNLTGQ